MKANRTLWAILFAAAVVPALAARADDSPVTLSRPYKEGEVTKYKVTVNTAVMGTDIVVTATTTSTVKEVKKNGDVVIETQNSDVKVTAAGMEQQGPPPGPPVTEV